MSSRKASNRSLSEAKRAKQDEFYTQYIDIQKEIQAYLDRDENLFRDQIVYCNCDDPSESEFFKFFAANFNRLGLKKLITTSYERSPIAGQATLFPEHELGKDKKRWPTAVAVVIDQVTDLNGDGAADLLDVEQFLRSNDVARISLKGTGSYRGGDFRSAQCLEFLDQSDIVVTNPPFSLFREFIATILGHKKRFIVVGPKNAITYKEIFPHIMEDRIWLGAGFSNGNAYFRIPQGANTDFAEGVYDSNTGLVKFRNVGWFTNIDHGRRHEILPLMTMADNLKYSKHKELRGKESYDRYDNYDAIEVPFVDAIPSDYDGVMGVPITFLDKYNPEQFEILGATQRGCHDLVPDTRRYDDYWEVRQNGTRTGSSGSKTNENANLYGNDGRKNYFVNSEGRMIQSAYQRIFIRHRRGKG